MKYFVIYTYKNQDALNSFHQANNHLNISITPVEAHASNAQQRQKLITQNIITSDNQYSPYELSLTEAHISLWKHAVETQQPITIFESNAVTHKDFLSHQQRSLLLHPNYELMIWGYDLNWNLCLKLLPSIPEAIYNFCGNTTQEIDTANNDLIDVELYQKNIISPQIIKVLSFAGLGCYTISPKGAEQLLKLTLPIANDIAPSYQDRPHGTNFYAFSPIQHRSNKSLDIEVNRHLHILNAYISLPMIAVLPTISTLSST
ncbi:glycosyltransferase family 25 protein [Commensalibacter oyaizuii]|uniref:Glycosyltransferase family 25 protein n=1 Tax=Commensalibacter oyaizuii TaxID=3043873 RepID=A0ABT6Q3Q3_9PROT|nr:glycosyltransferase family 25 protein [Commensalibacter sp. TBRC 16381]MDI2091761.1 glycosyltransferase family 25 protein [Commensalibacter sp. TBRC 16381]